MRDIPLSESIVKKGDYESRGSTAPASPVLGEENGQNAFTQWLYARFREKEERMGVFYREGWEGTRVDVRPTLVDWIRVSGVGMCSIIVVRVMFGI